MNKKLRMLALVLAMALFACPAIAETAPEPDFDLTQMGTTMAYSFLYNVAVAPEEYLGMRFRIEGVYDAMLWEETMETYHFIVVSDSTICCAQAFEFASEDATMESLYPGTLIQICGVLETYEELGETYYRFTADELTLPAAPTTP